jgi:hypothetical protein
MAPSTGAHAAAFAGPKAKPLLAEAMPAALSKSAVRDFKPMPALTRSAAGHLKSSVWRFLFR